MLILPSLGQVFLEVKWDQKKKARMLAQSPRRNYSIWSNVGALGESLVVVYLVWERTETIEPCWLSCNAPGKLHLP